MSGCRTNLKQPELNDPADGSRSLPRNERLDMDIGEYQVAVRRLFESGEATDSQWNQMTLAVIELSERDNSVPAIDAWVESDLGVKL